MATEPHAATLNSLNWREQLAALCEEMGVDQDAYCHDWREDMAALCEEMGIDQHAPCHDWREDMAALCAEVGVVMYV